MFEKFNVWDICLEYIILMNGKVNVHPLKRHGKGHKYMLKMMCLQ